jgi:glutamate synthase domain-containing protein 2
MKWTRLAGAAAAALGGVAAHDLFQRRHALLRNYPIIGHGRYLIETIGPELRQYVVAGNDEERPFSRDDRTWIYASSKMENNHFGFGTDNDVEHTLGYPVIKHRTFAEIVPPSGPHAAEHAWLPSAKVLGEARGRRHSFRPDSVVNISGMSFGSLSGPAIEALNRGAAMAGILHNTGEGGLSDHHRHGGELIFQIGTAYFGCRDERGRFDLDRLVEVVRSGPVRAIEVKLSQGAKPGLGGLLPERKVTDEIARIRGVERGVDCVSPSRHSEFHDVDSMLDFVERVADATGLPVGIKSAVGQMDFWESLVGAMVDDPDRGVDFITVDGGEGGTGAAPLVFADSVSLPWRLGFARVRSLFDAAGLADRVTFVGSGKLGLPQNAMVAFALGADMVHVGREAMMAVGCIQAQKCHTDRCPTGVATQDRWLQGGLDPQLKSVRLANYVRTLRRDLIRVAEACGEMHPGLVGADAIEILDGTQRAVPLAEVYGYEPDWGQPSAEQRATVIGLVRAAAPRGGSAEEPEVEASGH